MVNAKQLERDAKQAQERARRAFLAAQERNRRDTLKRRMIAHRGGA